MSASSRMTGDTVLPQTATISDFSEDAWADGTALDCHVQQQQAGPNTQHGSRGQVLFYKVFFSANPSLSPANRLKWTHQGGVELSSSKILRVLDAYARARPGEEPLFWVADCELVSTRRES